MPILSVFDEIRSSTLSAEKGGRVMKLLTVVKVQVIVAPREFAIPMFAKIILWD